MVLSIEKIIEKQNYQIVLLISDNNIVKCEAQNKKVLLFVNLE